MIKNEPQRTQRNSLWFRIKPKIKEEIVEDTEEDSVVSCKRSLL